MSFFNVGELFKRGGSFEIEGETPEEIYKNLCEVMPLPSSVTKESVFTGLCDRERVMSTAVGRGIALPHCRGALLKDNDEQQITVCYLKKPIDMNAPDGRKVAVMFVLLTSNSQTHLQVLSQLASLFKDEKFRQLINRHASAAELAALF